MSNQHPITPPPDLVEEWFNNSPIDRGLTIATQAAQWGADQELEACVEWLEWWDDFTAACQLRTARRPKPLSLKEQALKMLRPLSNPVMPGTPEYRLYEPQAEIIRRALEQLPDAL